MNAAPAWTAAPAHPAIGDDEVHVWRAAAPADARLEDDRSAVLSPHEQARRARFRHATRRSEFVTARWLARRVLGAIVGVAPAALRLRIDEHGKPHLDGHACAFSFNVAHAGGHVVLAVTTRARVGVDVERLRDDLEWRPLANRYFSVLERRDLAALEGAAARRAFFAGWTRKEALVKAMGGGIASGLDQFDVNVDPDAAPVLRACHGPPWDGTSWSLASFTVAPGFPGAAAAEGDPFALRLWDDLDG